MAVPVRRGCGSRSAGTYLEFGSDRGVPWWQLVKCPVKPLTQQQLHDAGISPVGVTFFQKDGTTHLYDWVGEGFYPNLLDFCWEIHLFGGSRRLASNTDFSRLTADSICFFIHPRAALANADKFYWAEGGYRGARLPRPQTHPCCLRLGDHTVRIQQDSNPALYLHTPPESCSGVWWETVSGGMKDEELTEEHLKLPVADMRDLSLEEQRDERRVTRVMPSFRYTGRRAPKGVTPDFRPGIFLRMRPSRLVVVKDSNPSDDMRRLEAASASGLGVSLVDM